MEEKINFCKGNVKAQRKRYNEKYKDKIKAKTQEKVICECGCEIMKGSLSGHKKSKRHISRLASL
tara:strand:- start:86 stop:280 length:195 start_codon:yes stop_codon:yes gene_type:complete